MPLACVMAARRNDDWGETSTGAGMHMLGTVLKDAGGWLLFAAACVGSVVFYDELKGGMAATLGLQMPPIEVAARSSTARLPANSDDSSEKSSSGGVELKVGRNGHFETTAEINGRPIDVLVDTGATLVALSYEDAERAGIYPRDSDFTQRTQTANGIGRAAPVMLERVTIGDITVRNVQASVAEPGRLFKTLLGMAFLSKLRVEMRGGTLVLNE
jgi:aspartyl protease family protein